MLWNRQSIGIHISTNCAPLVVDLFNFMYIKQISCRCFSWKNEKKVHVVRSLNFTDKRYHIMLYRTHFVCARFEPTTLVVIGTDCIGSFKSNYHTTTTAPDDDFKLWYINRSSYIYKPIQLLYFHDKFFYAYDII